MREHNRNERSDKHKTALSSDLLDELASDDANEGGVGAVGHRARRERFAGAGRTVQQHAFTENQRERD
jgi:hypothetical protein